MKKLNVFLRTALSLLLLFIGVIVMDVLAAAMWIAMSNLVFLLMTLLMMLLGGAVVLALIWVWRPPIKWTF